MSISFISQSTGIAQLAQQLMTQADANKDGQLSAAEFGTFLSKVLQGATNSASAHPAPALRRTQTLTPTEGATTPPVYLATVRNMPGFDQSRLDNPNDGDPKIVFARFAASKGGVITADDVRAFVAADPRWEIDPNSGPNDPHIRVKQSELDRWKPGVSVWQDVIRDSGGANQAQFVNAE